MFRADGIIAKQAATPAFGWVSIAWHLERPFIDIGNFSDAGGLGAPAASLFPLVRGPSADVIRRRIWPFGVFQGYAKFISDFEKIVTLLKENFYGAIVRLFPQNPDCQGGLSSTASNLSRRTLISLTS